MTILKTLWREFIETRFTVEWSDRDPVNNYEVDSGEINIYVWQIIAAFVAGIAIYLLAG